MNYLNWRNCAMENRQNTNSTILRAALSRIGQSANTNWAADSASFDYHIKCKKAYLLYRKLQVPEKVLPVVQNATLRTATLNAVNVSVQTIIPGSHLAKYGNFTYDLKDTIFKKIEQNGNGNVAFEMELPVSSESSLAMESWQEGLANEKFADTGKLVGTRDQEIAGKVHIAIKGSNSETKSHVRGVALEVMHHDPSVHTAESKKETSCWPASNRDSCMLCKNSLDYLTEYSEWLRDDGNVQCSDWSYVSEEEVLFAPNPILKFGGKNQFKKLIQRLTSPTVQGLWPVSENKSRVANQNLANGAKMQWKRDQCSFVSFSMSVDSEDDNATTESPGFSHPCLERWILAKSKELLQLIGQETDIGMPAKWQHQACSLRYEHPYWEFVNPGRICNRQDSTPRIQTYAEVCRAKATRTSTPRCHSFCKKSKSQSNLSVITGSQHVKSIYSHDNLTPLKLLTPLQSIDPWPALASSTPIKTRSEDFPELRNSPPVQFFTHVSKKKKKNETRNNSNYNVPCSNLSHRFADSSVEKQGGTPAIKPTASGRPRPITGSLNRDCGFEGEKSLSAPKMFNSLTSGTEGGSFNHGTAKQEHHHPKGNPNEMPMTYKKYHWQALGANKHSMAYTMDERSFCNGVTHQKVHIPRCEPDAMPSASKKYQNHRWHVPEPHSKASGLERGSFSYATMKQETYNPQCNQYFWTYAAEAKASAESNALQIEYGLSWMGRPSENTRFSMASSSQNPQPVILLPATHWMEDHDASQEENVFTDGEQRQPQLEKNYQYPYLWISGQVFDAWNFRNIASSIQYPIDTFLTSAPLVRLLEMQPFYAEAIRHVKTNSVSLAFPSTTSTSTSSTCHWSNSAGANHQTAWPTNVPLATTKCNLGNRGSGGPYNTAVAGFTVTSNSENSLCLTSVPQLTNKFLHQSHKRKPRSLQTLIEVIRVEMQELALPSNSTNDNQKESPENAADYGNAVELSSDDCQAAVVNPDKTASNLPAEESVRDANSKKLMRGLGILTSEECSRSSKEEQK